MYTDELTRNLLFLVETRNVITYWVVRQFKSEIDECDVDVITFRLISSLELRVIVLFNTTNPSFLRVCNTFCRSAFKKRFKKTRSIFLSTWISKELISLSWRNRWFCSYSSLWWDGCTSRLLTCEFVIQNSNYIIISVNNVNRQYNCS